MEWLIFKVIEREPAFRGQVFVRGFELVDKFRDIVRRLNG